MPTSTEYGIAYRKRPEVIARLKIYEFNRRQQKAARQREYQKNNPTYRRNHTIRRYGISPEQYNQMLEAQNGVCAICGKVETRKGSSFLSIDRDHSCCPHDKTTRCGKCVRGLLCFSCNKYLSVLNQENWIKNATNYLNTYRERLGLIA